jgi:hypothetical protein
MPEPPLARQMWHLIEPLHAMLYYAPAVFAEAESLGYPIDTRWPSYFAWRGAPLGQVGVSALTAAFYSFSPAMVGQHVPSAWRVATPAKLLDARIRAVDAGLRDALGDLIAAPALAEAAELARLAADIASETSLGRPLAAANADLSWPSESHLVLWHAATILREHRGDGHIAALLTHGLDGTEALVSFASVGAAPVAVFQSRGWTTEQWASAADRLRARGLVDRTGKATLAGTALRESVEQMTDELAAAPWAGIGRRIGRFAQLMLPITERIVRAGILPQQSTLGIRRP